MANLRELTWELDDRMMCINGGAQTLEDINTLLGHLREDMHTAQQKGEERAYFEEIFTKIRVLSELMHYTTNEYSKAAQEAQDIHLKMFDVIVKGKGERSAS
ncbi:hypothetical protein AB685_21885 [Bacillus sp. LL01]|uniref:hypothetical protein n=1 Tax=Bacillus sp. LL01 TaxID=1665556 RepID=UPI00064D62B0|nr:hypothetical protein [Bacillus sp. LL01]KMJ56440.1 hypothetical protein AB685_21885 [Bacillus sp. LL01]